MDNQSIIEALQTRKWHTPEEVDAFFLDCLEAKDDIMREMLESMPCDEMEWKHLPVGYEMIWIDGYNIKCKQIQDWKQKWLNKLNRK